MFPTVMNLLSVGVFSCERIVANFLTFVQHNRQKSCGEKFSFVEGDKKFIIFLLGGWLILVTFHFFLVGAINMFSELIHPLLKLPNCVLKQQPHIPQIFEVLGLAFSLFEEQEQALSVYCQFHSFLIFQKTRHCTRKQCSRLLCKYLIQRSPQDSKPSADNSTCYSLSKSITGCIKFTKRAELWSEFWHPDNVFELPGQNELIVWKMDSRFLFSRLTGWRSSPTSESDATLTLL